jgi:hypothetical protein
MSTRLIGGGHLWFGVRSRAIAYRAILIVTSTEGALLPTALLALVAIGTALLKAWSPATLATFSLGYRRVLQLMSQAVNHMKEGGRGGVIGRFAEL